MSYTYAISDPHGQLDVFKRAVSALDLTGENKLVLLGDYIPHLERCVSEVDYLTRCEESLGYVRELCLAHPKQVVALMGNHEFDLLESVDANVRSLDPLLVKWLRNLPLFYETKSQIFVHAGIDEDANDLWKWGTSLETYLAKNPITFGHFEKDIISGHISAYALAGKPKGFQGIYWDGASHYFIDGTTEVTGNLPILRLDITTHSYSFAIAKIEEITPWHAVSKE